VRVAPGLAPPLAACVLLFLAFPFAHAGVTYLDTRMPAAIAFLAVATLDVTRRPGRPARLVLACFAALVLLRVGVVTAQTLQFGRVVHGYERAFDRLPAGATLLIGREDHASDPADDVATSRPAHDGSPADLRTKGKEKGSRYLTVSSIVAKLDKRRLRQPPHVDALASIGREVFVPSLFAKAGVQPLVVDPRFAALKALQGDSALRIDTTAQLAALEARLAGQASGAGPLYLLLQEAGHRGLPSLAGAEVAAAGEGFRLLCLPDAGRPPP
jgi:hypothetical protein